METTIDKAGRVVVPRSIREAVGLSGAGRVDIVERDGQIVISAQPISKHLAERDGVTVCIPDEPLPTLDADAVRELLEATRR
jgi:AbrB family looped-hinge helix DNA binding protein